jgi:DNA-binding response OmpR family regulator
MLLIVDDDGAATATCAGVLRKEGYDVLTAGGTEDGWRAIATSRPDAILRDLAMPPVEQVVFLRRLRAHQHLRRTPIAVLAARRRILSTNDDETPRPSHAECARCTRAAQEGMSADD